MLVKTSVHTIFHNYSKRLKLVLYSAFMFMFAFAGISGCGLRDPQTGSLYGRIFDSAGNVVVGAQVYSIHREYEKVYSGSDGSFYISELQAGRHRIVITHPKFRLEEREVIIQPNQVTKLDVIKLSQGGLPKFISNVTVEDVTSSTAVIKWKTYRPLLCQVEYGPTTSYGSIIQELEIAENHSLKLENLTPDTVYHVRIRFTDESSVVWYSYDYPFKTLPGDSPSPPPKARIKELPSYGVVVIEWEPSTSSTVLGYDVWRRTGTESWQLLTTDRLDKNTFSYRDSNAPAGFFYQYAVTAVNGFGAQSEKALTSKIFMPGFISQDLRLIASESPYVLFSDLIIGVGTTLYAEPGVEIQVASSDIFRLGEDPDRVEILVQGRIVMTGTHNNPIRFTPYDGASSRKHWGGIKIRAGGMSPSELSELELFGCTPFAIDVYGIEANLSHIRIRYVEGGIKLREIRNNPPLTACSFDDISSAAISIYGCRRLHIEGCNISQADIGVWNKANGSEDRLTMRETHIFAREKGIVGEFGRSLFVNNLVVCSNGVGFEYITAGGQENTVDHCTIEAKTGIKIASGSPVVENNIIVNLKQEGEYGILVTTSYAPVFSFNNIYGFARAYEGCNPGTGAVSYPPDFVGGTPFDWHIRTASPLKRADRYGLEIGRYGKSYL